MCVCIKCIEFEKNPFNKIKVLKSIAKKILPGCKKMTRKSARKTTIPPNKKWVILIPLAVKKAQETAI